ncbi:MAG: HAD hydrolase-like protein, partial [Pseudonocardiales bacterium]
TGARRPLVVGDRLDTDIEGAVAAGADSMLVLTGLTTPGLLVAAPRGQRPTYVAADVAGLLQPQPAVTCGEKEATCAGFTASRVGDALLLSGSGEDAVDALRALCGASWSADGQPQAIRAAGAAAAAALRDLDLPTASRTTTGFR